MNQTPGPFVPGRYGAAIRVAERQNTVFVKNSHAQCAWSDNTSKTKTDTEKTAVNVSIHGTK